MAKHAGFATVLTFKQEIFQNILNLLYIDGSVPHQFQIGTTVFSANFFFDFPQLGFHATNPSTIQLDVTGWGPMTLGSAAERKVIFKASLQIPHQVTLANNGDLNFQFDTSGLSIQSYSFVPFEGDAFSMTEQFMLNSSYAEETMEEEIRNYLTPYNQFFPPIQTTFLLGQFIRRSFSSVTARAVNGAFAIGLDVNDVNGGVVTHGSPETLQDIGESEAFGMCINELVWEDTALGLSRPLVGKAFRDGGATLDSYSVSMCEGYLFISGSGSRLGGTATFSLEAHPHISEPTTAYWSEPAPRQEVWMEIRNFDLDIDRSGWGVVLEVFTGIITFGIAAAIIESMISAMRSAAYEMTSSFNGFARGEVSHTFTFSDMEEGTIQLTLKRFEFHAYGIYVTSTFNISAIPYIDWPYSREIDIEQFEERMLAVDYRADHPYQSDPQLSAVFTVRRNDTNAVIYTLPGHPSAIFGMKIPQAAVLPILNQINAFTVQLQVTRNLGSESHDVHNSIVTLTIKDRLDRTHPFVRWGHYVIVPNVRAEADGSQTEIGMVVKFRKSKIHRTDFPGRCKMASRYSIERPHSKWAKVPIVQRRDYDPANIYLQYLDQLPFARNRIAANHDTGILCHYCFFGSPVSTTPAALP